MNFNKKYSHAVNDDYPMPWVELYKYLKSIGKNLTFNPAPERFLSGMGNLNYKITLDGRPVVLRRPPLGPIPPGANNMTREHSLLKALAPSWNLIPQAICLCSDPEVFGAPFQIMEYKEGKCIIGDNIPKEWNNKKSLAKISKILISLLSTLHSINYKAIGLQSFGKPEGFLSRQLNGWKNRCIIATNNKPSKICNRLHLELSKTFAADINNPCIIHNDFKLDNILISKNETSNTIEATAIIDWDQATIGSPLYDLATLLSYWIEKKDPSELQLLKQMPTTIEGFPSRSEAINMYQKTTGFSMTGFRWIYSLAMYKLGVVFLQLYAQYLRGSVKNSKFSAFENISNAVFERGLEVLIKKTEI